MVRTTVYFPGDTYDRLRAHLLPKSSRCEEAAFLFTRAADSPAGLTLSVVDEILLPPEGFASRSRSYLELTDDTRARVIKRAHDLGAGLVECHSHPGQHGACFSWSDLHGSDEFVPHLLWRLPGRPYAAIVFASDSVDALIWTRPGIDATAVDAILFDGHHIEPTQLTLANWSDIYECRPI